MSKLNFIPRSRPWLVAYSLASLIGLTAVVGLLSSDNQPGRPDVPAASALARPVIAPEVANEQIDWARSESLRRLDGHFAPIDELFRQARTYEFADNCLGWESKWYLAKDKFTGSHEHADFIASAFRTSVLDASKLQRLLEQCTAGYEQELASIDGEFLVRLNIDLEGLPQGAALASGTDANRLEQRRIIERVISASEADVPEWMAREAVSWAISEAATSILLSLGQAAGVISEQDANSGWKPFATNVAVGIAVDKAITEATDPVGKLQAVVDRQLAGLRTAVLEGSATAPGILPRLRAYAEARSEARRALIQPTARGGSISNLSF